MTGHGSPFVLVGTRTEYGFVSGYFEITLALGCFQRISPFPYATTFGDLFGLFDLSEACYKSGNNFKSTSSAIRFIVLK
uniref:Peptidase_S26 domain-containing protein n=1 Tax=Strongyloides papillosus TaxID=174720 RepID=A0A0N5B7S0_STREA